MPKINTRSIRAKLWNSTPYCFWCGRYTMNYSQLTIDNNFNGKSPPLMATLDHLFPIVHPKRNLFRNSVVIACNECNGDRDAIHRNFNNILRQPILKMLFESRAESDYSQIHIDINKGGWIENE